VAGGRRLSLSSTKKRSQNIKGEREEPIMRYVCSIINK
jgi:hypothetical protein